MSRVFNKYVAAAVLLVLLFATGVKIHSVMAGPPPRNWNYQNLERIKSPPGKFSFAVFGDNQNSVTVFNDLIDRLNHDDIAFAFDNGDLVCDGEVEKYRFFLRQVERLEKPLLTAMGNHETYAGKRGNYYDIFGPFYYSFAVGQSYFIVLDNADERNPGPFQLEWLEAELEKSRAYEQRFVFMHIPLYDTRRSGFGLKHGMKNRATAKKLNRLLDRYDVTMLFASHIHEYDRGVWGRTPYIITGGAGGELAGTDPDRYFFHFLRVKVLDGRVEYEVVRLKTPAVLWLNRLIHSTWLYSYSLFATHYFDLVLAASVLFLLVFALQALDRRKRKPARVSKGGADEDG